jgi:hypothetical protein
MFINHHEAASPWMVRVRSVQQNCALNYRAVLYHLPYGLLLYSSTRLDVQDGQRAGAVFPADGRITAGSLGRHPMHNL